MKTYGKTDKGKKGRKKENDMQIKYRMKRERL